MKFEIETIKVKYAEFNKTYFNNELPEVIDFKSFKSKRVLAKASKRFKPNYTFFYNTQLSFKDELAMDNVIIHEMVHFWQFQNNLTDFHGRSFKMKSMLIDHLSNGVYQISRLADSSNLVFETKPKTIKTETCLVLNLSTKDAYKVFKVDSEAEERRIKDYIICSRFGSPIRLFKYVGEMFNDQRSCKLTSRSFRVNKETIAKLVESSSTELLFVFNNY